MKYSSIIFDMDGTIVETGHIWKEATQIVIARRGVSLTPEEQAYLDHHLLGLALPQSCAVIKEITKSDESVAEIMKEKSATAGALYANGVYLIPGFEKFHSDVMQANISTALATNADDNTLELTRTALNLNNYFGEHLYNISHVNFMGKPNPAIYLYAANKLGSDPKQCIAIEDSAHGIKAAKDAGMFCFGINTHGRKEQLANADIIINSYEEIDLEKFLN